MTSLEVLLLDDDGDTCELLGAWLAERGCAVRAVALLDDARRELEDWTPELALIDLKLPDGNGLELLEEVAREGDIEAVMISGRSTVDSAVAALRMGASDYLVKPVDLGRLEVVLESAKRAARLRGQVAELRTELKRLGRLGSLIGASPAMQRVYAIIEKVAPTDETVLITGATGTGKEVTARSIHELSRRSDGPFVAVNCSAVSASLLESEFFGHEKGAFTGADRRRAGLFEQAKGGTLFLDEVSEMSVDLQAKLLRVLEERELVRVGGSTVVPVDTRILAASNGDLGARVAQGSFREDLLYRLQVFPLELPPLSERDGDVALLAAEVLRSLNDEYDEAKRLTPAALSVLEDYSWPGNVRELSNALRRAFVLADDQLQPEHLLLGTGAETSPRASSKERGEADPVRASVQNELSFDVGESIASVEQRLIEATLEVLDGDKREAAETLGISLKTLYSRLKVYSSVRAAKDS